MQCPRCYFDNPTEARVCEYCGADLTSDGPPAALAGSSAAKRRTMLGEAPPPQVFRERPPASPRPALDPDDPFRVAARGIVGGAAAEPAAAPAPPAPRGHRTTIVDGAPAPTDAEVIGALLVYPHQGDPWTTLLRAGRTRLGRDSDNDVVLDDDRVSADHAVLRVEGERAWLLDTSSNGTLVSGTRYVNDKADLSDDAVLLIGRTHVVVKLLSQEALHILRGSD